MSKGFYILAAMPSLGEFFSNMSNSSKTRIYLILVIAGVSLIGLAVAILLAVRRTGGKSKRRRRRGHRPHHGEHDASNPDHGAEDSDGEGNDLPRPGMRRKVTRIINPTLSQTGGLPPRREDGKPPPNLP